ncbi:MAG: hypothetical protein GF317_24695 [Candidatus Lokiarchaeota archaeon]|nr:hypothetical protein [Candidatus Lokiarchaeota archaeon]MBD3202560.1 hypothetical protein [Candidatus Lokiarchaeota archaeon]
MNEKQSKKERAPINISISDLERAFRKVEEFQKLIDKGKTPEEIFDDLVNLITIKDDAD